METVIRHTHNGTDSQQLSARDAIIGCPMPSLTTKDESAFSTGGVANLKASDVVILENMRTRLNELEERLQAIQALL